MVSKGKLWQFSLDFYAKPDVQTACLSLQNDYSADVNLVLYLLYKGSLQQQLSLKTIRELDDLVRVYREQVIKPIRAIRQSLKSKQYGDDESLYNSMLSYELSAEKLEQAYLETLEIETSNITQQAAKDNLNSYAELLGIHSPNETLNLLIRHSAT